MSAAFWIVVVVSAMLLVAILTGGFNEDKTHGL
jgi:hypothetical protein